MAVPGGPRGGVKMLKDIDFLEYMYYPRAGLYILFITSKKKIFSKRGCHRKVLIIKFQTKIDSNAESRVGIGIMTMTGKGYY